MARLVSLAGAVALLFAGVSANTQMIPEIFRGGRLYRDLVGKENAHHAKFGFEPNQTASWFPAPVNHWDSSMGTFQDKFYYDTTFWDKANGPCMFYLNGEAPLGGAVGGYMVNIANATNACTVAIEHRWYGESLPGSLSDKSLFTSTLTVEQAMADVISLMEYFETNIAGRKLTWMLVGGSYSGAMTVWLNEVYPGRWKASWAASGVVKATQAFYEYDAHIKNVITGDCYKALAFVFKYANIMWEDPTQRQMLFDLFGGDNETTKTQFFDMMSYSYEGMVQYSQRTMLCNGVLPLQYENPMAMMTRYSNLMMEMWGPSFAKDCRWSKKCMQSKANNVQWSGQGLSWFWQVCSEFGWWQIGYPGGIKPQNISVAYYIDQCRESFYNNTAPDVWAFNKKYHGLHPVTQGYIFATQGSDDPWSTTGLSVNQGPTFPVNTAQCTNCGHCSSMMSPEYTDPPELIEQRELVADALVSWLQR